MLRERTAVARSDGSVHSLFPVAVGAAEGEAIREWVTRENAARTLEIGLGYGIAALFACEGLLANGGAAARHVVIDPYQAARFSDCGLDGVFLDLVYLDRLVRAGGVVFVDDYQLPSVARAVAFCTTNLGWKVEELSTVDDLHHWAVLRTADVPPERPFDHYVDF